MSKVYGEAYRHIRICVDSYEHGNPAGRYCHPAIDSGGTEFQSLGGLLLGIDRLLDREQFPQSFTEKRSFLDVPELPAADSPGGPGETGSVGTFAIRIMFRQHTSWQGTVLWMEGRREQAFRSVLELIGLLDSALAAPRAA